MSIGAVNAIQIDVYYPDNNTTTEIYYANESEYNYILNNTINETNLSIVILKDQIEYEDIIKNPEKLADIKYIGLFIFLLLMGTITLVFIKVFK